MKFVAAVLLIYFGSSGPAWSYVDPGSGMFILQVLAAIGVGI